MPLNPNSYRKVVFGAAVVTLAIGLSACGGNTKSPPVQAAGDAGSVIEARPIDKTHGWALTDKGLQTSADGGARFSERNPNRVAPAALAAVTFRGNQRGWAAVRTTPDVVEIVRTANGGGTWQTLGQIPAAPGSGGGPLRLVFTDENNGFALLRLASSSAGTASDLFGTTDGGANWTRLTAPFFGDLRVLDRSHLLIAGGPSGGAVAVSNDAGRSWATPEGLPGIGPNLVVVAVASEGASVGLLTSELEGETGPAVLTGYESSDFGQTWRPDGRTLRVPGLSAELPVASAGFGKWVVLAPDGSQTWASTSTGFSKSAAKGLSGSIAQVSGVANGPLWAVAVTGGCAEFKADCAATRALYVSNDSGASWERGGARA